MVLLGAADRAFQVQLTMSINKCQYRFCLTMKVYYLCPYINTSYCCHLSKCSGNYRHDMPNSVMKIQLPSSLHLIIFFAFGINRDHMSSDDLITTKQ